METAGYLISLVTSDSNRYAVVHVFQVIDSMRMVFGTSRNGVNLSLFVLPSEDKTASELMGQIRSVSDVRNFSVVALSKLPTSDELKKVRTLLKDYGMNASSVPDADLAMYLVSTLAGEYTYYLYADHQQNKNGLSPVRIKRLEDLRQELAQEGKDPGRVVRDTTEIYNGMEIHEVTLESSSEHEPPPPPPAPPANLGQMSDAQIKRWMRKNDSRKLQDKNIQIKRTAAEVLISIKFNGTTETIQYKIKK